MCSTSSATRPQSMRPRWRPPPTPARQPFDAATPPCEGHSSTSACAISWAIRTPRRSSPGFHANAWADARVETAMTTPEQTRDAWDKFAAGYDQTVTPFSMRIAEDALRRVDIRPGMRLLDVAAGGGALSIPAARLGAQVLATDFSPAMVGRLDARAREQGLSNLKCRDRKSVV